MPTCADIESILQSLPSLTEMLDGDYTSMALVRADGTWYAEQNDAVRPQHPILSPENSEALTDLLRTHGPVPCHGDWWARPLCTHHGATAVFERRPTVAPEGLSPHTLELLRAQLEPDANGVVFGTSRRGRTGVLLSLASHLPSGLVLYVGPVPPVESADDPLMYIAPPRHDRDRRELAPIFERAAAILFDGPVTSADLRLLLAGPHSTNRWIAVDVPGPDNWADIALHSSDVDAEFTTHIGVRTSAVDVIRIDYFAIRDDGDWDILFGDDDPADTDIPVDDDRLSAQLTSPIDRRRGAADGNDRPALEAPPADTDDKPSSSDGEEGDFDVAALMEDDDTPGAIRESGEIDVPGFVSRQKRDAAMASDATPDPTDALRGQRIDDQLPGLVASSDIDEVEMPELDPEQLRQTYDGPVEVDAVDADDPPPPIDPPSSTVEPDIADDPATQPIELDDDRSGSDDRSDGDANHDSSTSGSFSRRPSSSGRARSLRRTSQLGAESSSGRNSSDRRRTRTRRRRDTSGRRVLPVPSSKRDAGDEVTTRDLNPIDGDDPCSDSSDDGADTGADTPSPIEVDPGDTGESTVELDVRDELNAADEPSSADDDT